MLANLAALVIASQPVAVMVHGAGGGGWEYDLWRPVFEGAGYRVIARDLLPTDKGYAKTTFEDYVKQVESWGRADVLIGASMGGVIALKAAEKMKPSHLVLVCSALPAGVGEPKVGASFPSVMRWHGGPYQDTVSSMPDSDEPTRLWAWPKWRDESGNVLNALRIGIKVKRPRGSVLCIIPLADDTVAPDFQMKLASWAGASIQQYEGMSHVGPLLSTHAQVVAQRAIDWVRAPD